MRKNAAGWDRTLRAIAGLAMLTAGAWAPLPLWIRFVALGGTGIYLLGSAVIGSCVGYRLMGISTCPTKST